MKSPYDPMTGISSAKQLEELDKACRTTTGMDLQKLLLPQNSALAEAIRGIDSAHKLVEAATGGSRFAEAVRGITGPLDQISANMASARRLHEALGGVNSITSRFAEAARGITDPLNQIGNSFSSARQIAEALEGMRINARLFDDQFRVVNQIDLIRINDMVSAATAPLKGIAKLTAQFDQFFTAPLINIHDSLSSARAIADLTTIGAVVNAAPPFDLELVNSLRTDLGDWRDAVATPPDLLDDPTARLATYVDHGFRTELTDFPAQGFDAALTVTNIRLGPITAELPSPPDDVPDCNIEGYRWLYILETQLRAHIVKRLQAIHDRWEQRLPNGMHDKWQDKKAKAVAEGRAPQPIINYADFSDYLDIILRADNWRDCFKETFKRQESIREGFNRLYPIRNIVAHNRILISEDLLFLHLEARVILRAIGYL